MRKCCVFCLLTLLPIVAFGGGKGRGEDCIVGDASECMDGLVCVVDFAEFGTCQMGCEDINRILDTGYGYTLGEFESTFNLQCDGVPGSFSDPSCEFTCYTEDGFQRQMHVCTVGQYSNTDRTAECQMCPDFGLGVMVYSSHSSGTLFGANSITNCWVYFSGGESYTDTTGTFQILSDERVIRCDYEE